MPTEFEDNLLGTLLDPVAQSLNSKAAEMLINLRADEAAQQRIDVLADKCNEDQLTAMERSEYEAYVSAANLIAILQSKACKALANNFAA